MATLGKLELPDNLYERLKELASADNRSVEAQAIAILQNAISNQMHYSEDKRRQDVLQLLEEMRIRRESRSSNTKWLDSTELIREDRSR
jgi:antitoxin FitA